ncbi:hypothetical protein ACJ8LR_18535 [Serratia sp. CY56810]|uniref:hypothetical protein n=1 Tax=Serratia sp. CY56810 TaxID=3383642 RepID=UPI003F9F1D62
MSTEKLSELSKPKAFIVTGGRAHHDWPFIIKSTAERARDERKDGAVVEPLYSQEYVSALLAELEATESRLHEVATVCVTAEQRIAELEAIRAAAEKLARCKGRYHSEQNYRTLAALFGVTTPDLPPVEGDSEAVIAELRAKLAVPVRLPEPYQTSCGESERYLCPVEVAEAIRAAGFKVEGGE